MRFMQHQGIKAHSVERSGGTMPPILNLNTIWKRLMSLMSASLLTGENSSAWGSGWSPLPIWRVCRREVFLLTNRDSIKDSTVVVRTYNLSKTDF